MKKIDKLYQKSAEKPIFYGLPHTKQYPMPDEAHVKSAIKFFNYVGVDDEEELAENINKMIKKYNMTDINVGDNNRFKKYFKPAKESFLTQSAPIVPYAGTFVKPELVDEDDSEEPLNNEFDFMEVIKMPYIQSSNADFLEVANESLFARKKAVSELLTVAERTLKKRLKTVEDCDDELSIIDSEAAKFNECIKTLSKCKNQYDSGKIDKKNFNEQVRSANALLKKNCKNLQLRLGNMVDDTTAVTPDELKAFKEYITGIRQIVKTRRRELQAKDRAANEASLFEYTYESSSKSKDDDKKSKKDSKDDDDEAPDDDTEDDFSGEMLGDTDDDKSKKKSKSKKSDDDDEDDEDDEADDNDEDDEDDEADDDDEDDDKKKKKKSSKKKSKKSKDDDDDEDDEDDDEDEPEDTEEEEDAKEAFYSDMVMDYALEVMNDYDVDYDTALEMAKKKAKKEVCRISKAYNKKKRKAKKAKGRVKDKALEIMSVTDYSYGEAVEMASLMEEAGQDDDTIATMRKLGTFGTPNTSYDNDADFYI